jgi:hypothetical protein
VRISQATFATRAGAGGEEGARFAGWSAPWGKARWSAVQNKSVKMAPTRTGGAVARPSWRWSAPTGDRRADSLGYQRQRLILTRHRSGLIAEIITALRRDPLLALASPGQGLLKPPHDPLPGDDCFVRLGGTRLALDGEWWPARLVPLSIPGNELRIVFEVQSKTQSLLAGFLQDQQCVRRSASRIICLS